MGQRLYLHCQRSWHNTGPLLGNYHSEDQEHSLDALVSMTINGHCHHDCELVEGMSMQKSVAFLSKIISQEILALQIKVCYNYDAFIKPNFRTVPAF